MWSRKFGTLGLIQSEIKKMCFKIDPGRNADHSVPPVGFFFVVGGLFCFVLV